LSDNWTAGQREIPWAVYSGKRKVDWMESHWVHCLVENQERRMEDSKVKKKGIHWEEQKVELLGQWKEEHWEYPMAGKTG
jgi:hypothetical protein